MADETTRNVKSRILDAAISLLRKAGAKKLAQPQVAREAGVPQGHLTYYFPRKMDLLIGVATQVATALQQEFEKGASSDERSSEALTDVVFNAERNRSLVGLITEADVEEEVSDTVQKAHRFAQLTISRLIARHPDEPEAQLTMALLLGLGVQQLLFKDRSKVEVQALIEQWQQWLQSTAINDDGIRRSATVLRAPAETASELRVASSKKA